MANKELVKATATAVQTAIEKNRETLLASCPDGFNFERMVRSAMNAIQTTPAIASCTPSSLFLACVRAFSCGIEPNGPTHEGYIVPFKNTATFMPSYRGMIALALRSGKVKSIYAHEYREGDDFRVKLGTAKSIEHTPAFGNEQAKTLAYYAVAVMEDGTIDFEVMTTDEIEKVRKSSHAANNGPWVDWYDEMAKKTAIKRLCKRLPSSIELARTIEADNKAAAGEQDLVIDIGTLDVPEDMPESSPIEQMGRE